MGYIPKTLPGFTYTGTYSTELRADWGWIIRMKTSGTLTITDRKRKIDAFLVGGGGGGGTGNDYPGGGGGGGCTKTVCGISLSSGTGYWIEVGQGGASNSNGSASRAFGYQANGGSTENATARQGGAGGSGGGAGQYTGTPGNGGSDGADGAYSHKGDTLKNPGGAGQGSTTREFGMSGWTLYAGGGGGGGGGSFNGSSSDCGYGGAGGGGNGYNPSTKEKAQSGSANTGGGGGGGNGGEGYTGGAGGSGIVCIRNSADDVLPVVFNGIWLTNLVHNGTDVERLIYNGTRLFMRAVRRRGRTNAGNAEPVCGQG